MEHRISVSDRDFLTRLHTCRLPPSEFHHREHIRLAYIMIVLHGVEDAVVQTRTALLSFLQHNGVDPARYHVTLTRAWILAVAHFMQRTAPCHGSEAFLEQNAILLDQQIMLTHYSRERLFSDDARAQFLPPDLDPIPQHPAP